MRCCTSPSSALLVAVLAVIVRSERPASVYVCEAGDETFLGKYDLAESAVAVVAYVNANNRGIFRHSGFWYMGDVSDWPPVTHYRCILDERCHTAESDAPPLQGYQATQRNGVQLPPVVSLTPCAEPSDSRAEL